MASSAAPGFYPRRRSRAIRFRRATLRVRFIVTIEGLETTLYKLETGQPYLIIDNVQCVGTGPPPPLERTRTVFDVSLELFGYLRAAGLSSGPGNLSAAAGNGAPGIFVPSSPGGAILGKPAEVWKCNQEQPIRVYLRSLVEVYGYAAARGRRDGKSGWL